MLFYDFGPNITPETTDKNVLGGKGASLAIMSEAGIAVPPGFTIPISYCVEYQNKAGIVLADLLGDLTVEAVNRIKAIGDKMLGPKSPPPLVSVRSGAPISMPGMMDTILNVGLTTKTIGWWAKRLGARTAWDSYRRLIHMLGTTAYHVPAQRFNALLDNMKSTAGVELDTDLTVAHLKELCSQMKEAFHEVKGEEFPDTMPEQLLASIEAVFGSWNSERAISYREINKITGILGTAVNIQTMVFGNMGDTSATGVLFTRDPLTGSPEMYGEFLINAQGEDVVAGIRTPMPIAKMGPENDDNENGSLWNSVYNELVKTCKQLELHYRDMVDIEFTVQEGKLYILQSRVGKRSAKAAVRIANQLTDEGLVYEPFKLITKEQFKTAVRPIIDPEFDNPHDAMGINASPGVAVGKVIFSSKKLVELAKANPAESYVLMSHETTPEDIEGMHHSSGILTIIGGSTSHAAVVARAMDKPCVVGCTNIMMSNTVATIGGKQIKEGDTISICGSSGRVWVNIEVPTIKGDDDPFVARLIERAMEDVVPMVKLDSPTLPYTPTSVAVLGTELFIKNACEELVGTCFALAEKAQQVVIVLDTDFVYRVQDLMATFQPFSVAERVNDLLFLIAEAAEQKPDLAKKLVWMADQSWVMPKGFKDAGIKVVAPISNVGDLMAGTLGAISEAKIDELFGSKQAYDEFMKLLKDAGKPVEEAPRVNHALTQLFTLLA